MTGLRTIASTRAPRRAASCRRAPGRSFVALAGASLLLCVLSACGIGRTERPTRPIDERRSPAAAPSLAASGFAELSEHSPRGAAMPPGFEGRRWTDILRDAEGRTVDWYLWAGDPRINEWIRRYVVDMAAGRYGIDLRIVPVADTADAVAAVLGGRSPIDGAATDGNRREDGPVDLLWVNGENFRALRAADALYGPWTAAAPNSRYVDLEAPLSAFDFGVPVDGFELPWGRAHLVMIHDTARVPEPPRTIGELFDFAREHPGSVTYPAPPDFTGSAFVRLVCMDTLGPAAFAETEAAPDPDPAALAPCAERLRDIAPALWREGRTYPASAAQLDDLFADGEIEFSVSFNPASASQRIADGRFPETTRSFVFDGGTLTNSHFLAIPHDAADASAAMVVANFLLSPEAQYAKAQPSAWGDFTVLEADRLEPIWAETFAALDLGPATLRPEDLADRALSEPPAAWIEAIEAMWLSEVVAP